MIETYNKIIVHNKNGELIKDSGLVPSHSYAIQFLQMVESLFGGVFVTATDVDGAGNTIIPIGIDDPDKARVDAAAGNDTYGIVVGTNVGATPEDNENYMLDTKILHSAAGEAGKLNYQAVTMVTPTVSGANVDFDITRTFLNETGATITVKEIGIILKNVDTTKYFLLLRDVVADEDVLDGYTLTVVYTLRTTV